GGPGIGETDVDPARDQGPHQTFRTVHSVSSVRRAERRFACPEKVTDPDQSSLKTFVKGGPCAWLLSPARLAQILTAPFEIRYVRLRKYPRYGLLPCPLVKHNARNPMTRIFAALTAALILLAGILPSRATSDEDFFGIFVQGRGQRQY